MGHPKTDRPKSPSRRAALRRLAGAVVAGYVVPEVLFLSAARAESSGPTSPTAPSEPSAPAPSAPVPSGSAPSGSGPVSSASSAEEGARETCSVSGSQGSNTISISRGDLQRSQEAIAAGHAQPLEQIWARFRSEYDGNIIGVEFLNRRSNARYRFRAISKAGRLETVTISAQTGAILRIVGC